MQASIRRIYPPTRPATGCLALPPINRIPYPRFAGGCLEFPAYFRPRYYNTEPAFGLFCNAFLCFGKKLLENRKWIETYPQTFIGCDCAVQRCENQSCSARPFDGTTSFRPGSKVCHARHALGFLGPGNVQPLPGQATFRTPKLFDAGDLETSLRQSRQGAGWE